MHRVHEGHFRHIDLHLQSDRRRVFRAPSPDRQSNGDITTDHYTRLQHFRDPGLRDLDPKCTVDQFIDLDRQKAQMIHREKADLLRDLDKSKDVGHLRIRDLSNAVDRILDLDLSNSVD